LIVDDQLSFRRAARAVVELTDGFVVVGEVANGEDSIAAAYELQADLVLMDVHLSGIDGLEACRQIRSVAVGASPVVFLFSTYEAAEFVRRTAQCGAVAYLAKAEFGPERLTAAWAAVSV
jgi:DNA-binding NarL/FixJ family response regulator